MILESVIDAGRLFKIVGAATEKALQALGSDRFLAETVLDGLTIKSLTKAQFMTSDEQK